MPPAFHRKAATAAGGLLLCLTTAVPAQAEPAAGAQAFPQLQLPRPLHGAEAVSALGGRLPEVAARYGLSPERFAQLLRQDRTAWLDRQGRLFYIEDFAPAAVTGEAVALPEQAPMPLSETFKLHSRSGSSRVLYMDFDGHVVSNTAWNSGTINAAPYDTDGDPTTFSEAELETIQLTWQRVANDFAPFDIDVTTEEPPADSITRNGSADQVYGTRAVVTDNDFGACASCGGVAYIDVFDDTSNHDYYQPAWVFNQNDAKIIAETLSHEVGHNLGLHHDGTVTEGYYSGHGNGATAWGPIMGAPFDPEVSQWSKGEYPLANNAEDDLAIISGNGAPYRPDDFPNGYAQGYAALARLQSAVSGGSSFVVDQGGVIGRTDDVDDFAFTAGSGAASLTVTPVNSPGVNLDAVIELRDASGSLLASANDTSDLGGTLSATLAPGDYFVRIHNAGDSDPAPGYSSYGSLGEYRISGSFVPLDTTPNSFSFTQSNNVPRNSLQTSNTIAVSGISAPTSIVVSNGSYSLNGGSFTTADGMVVSGDSVRVQHTSSSLNYAGVSTTLNLGGVTRTFRSVTADTVPADFSFAAATNVARSSLQTSSTVTITGITAPAAISVSGGSYSINGATFTTAAGSVAAGDTLRVKHTASSINYTAVNTTVNVGGLSRVFRSVTADTVPAAFSFTAVDNVPSGSLQTSNAITVSGISAAASISVARGSYSINGAAFTTAPGTVSNGDSVRVQRSASASPDTTVSTALTIGEATRGLFSITTGP